MRWPPGQSKQIKPPTEAYIMCLAPHPIHGVEILFSEHKSETGERESAVPYGFYEIIVNWLKQPSWDRSKRKTKDSVTRMAKRIWTSRRLKCRAQRRRGQTQSLFCWYAVRIPTNRVSRAAKCPLQVGWHCHVSLRDAPGPVLIAKLGGTSSWRHY